MPRKRDCPCLCGSGKKFKNCCKVKAKEELGSDKEETLKNSIHTMWNQHFEAGLIERVGSREKIDAIMELLKNAGMIDSETSLLKKDFM